MKAGSLAIAGSAAGLSLTAMLVACATDGSAPAVDPDPESRVPVADSGAEAAHADAEAGSDTCQPDALCPNGPFDPATPGGALDVRTQINVIRGRSATDVWAAGAQGAIAHFDGTTWKRSESGTTETLHAMWLRDPGEIAFASLARLHTRDLDVQDAGAPPSAGGWTAMNDPPGPLQLSRSSRRLTASWTAPGADWLWCTTLEFPAVSPEHAEVNGLWRVRVEPSTNTLEVGAALPPGACDFLGCRQLTSIHGATANDLWAVGPTGATVHITDAQSNAPRAKVFNSKTWAGLNGVWAASETEAWAVGGVGTIRHYTGHASAWEIVPNVPTSEDLRAVWGSSHDDVWAVGDAAVVLHYDGKDWSRVKVAGLGDWRPNLKTVWTPAPGHVWVGGEGVILSLGGKP